VEHDSGLWVGCELALAARLQHAQVAIEILEVEHVDKHRCQRASAFSAVADRRGELRVLV